MDTLFWTQPYTAEDVINAFFLYSFLGWCMECVVIRREKGKWENRGFAHLPFCIIYGFGAMLGYIVLKPFSFHYGLLFCVGAIVATAFEYLTAVLMRHLFGSVWWDYTNKKFNYKGVLCLESTLGWGCISVLLFAVLQKTIFSVVTKVPNQIAGWLAFILVSAYALDFAVSMRNALREAHTKEEQVLQ